MVTVLVKNIAEFESLMWAELMDILGYNLKQTPPQVRRSWPTDGAPDWKITDDVIFMQVTESAEDIMQPVDTFIEDFSQNIICPTPSEFQFAGRLPVFYVPSPPPFIRTEVYTGLPPEQMDEGTGCLLKLIMATARVFQVNLNAYGPSCYESLLKLRLELLRGRQKLKKQKIYIIPGKDSIQYAPELFQGRWWKRADLTLYFNVLVSVESIVKAIEEVNVTIKVNEPAQSIVTHESGIIIKKG